MHCNVSVQKLHMGKELCRVTSLLKPARIILLLAAGSVSLTMVHSTLLTLYISKGISQTKGFFFFLCQWG